MTTTETPNAAAAELEETTTVIPTWARVAVYVFGATVGGCALAASGFDLFGLARALGFALGTCLAVPIGLDAGATTCGVLWIASPPGSPARRRWRTATLIQVGASAVLNGLSVLAAPHWLTGALAGGSDDTRLADVGLLPGGVAVLIAVLIAFTFPLVAAWMVHAILRVRDSAARNRAPRRRWLRELLAAVAEWSHDRAAARRARRAAEKAERLRAESERSGVAPGDSGATPVAPGRPESVSERPGAEERPVIVAKAPRRRVVPAAPRPARRRPGRTPTMQARREATVEAPPQPTGRKKVDARAFYLYERRHGRTWTPGELNKKVDADSLVKPDDVKAWAEEFARDRLELVGSTTA